MHGLGNDFAIVDCRRVPFDLDSDEIRRFANRHSGVGFDQLLTILPSRDPACAVAYRVHNADGSVAGQCGNGVRCIARWLERDGVVASRRFILEGPSGPVAIELQGDGHVTADMGEPDFDPAAVPIDPAAIPRGEDSVRFTHGAEGSNWTLGVVSMGNPHAVVAVTDVAAAPVATLGPALGSAAMFPAGANIGFAERVAGNAIRLRVHERGAGETLACGSGACAAVAVLRRRGEVDADVDVTLPGGVLAIHWPGPGSTLRMTGPAVFVCDGDWNR